jgi:hypothetical protein
MVDSNELTSESNGPIVPVCLPPNESPITIDSKPKLKSKAILKNEAIRNVMETSREAVVSAKEVTASTSGTPKTSKTIAENKSEIQTTTVSQATQPPTGSSSSGTIAAAVASTSLPRFGVAVPNRVFVGGIPSEVSLVSQTPVVN